MAHDKIPFKVCPACFIAIYAAKHICDECGSIQPCAVKRDDEKRKGQQLELDFNKVYPQ